MEILLEFIKEIFTIFLAFVGMADLAQLVRASDCGPEGHGFESHSPPHRLKYLSKYYKLVHKILEMEEFEASLFLFFKKIKKVRFFLTFFTFMNIISYVF